MPLNICVGVLRVDKPHALPKNNLLILQTSRDSCPKLLLGQVIVVFVCFPAAGSGICWLWELAGVCPHVAAWLHVCH